MLRGNLSILEGDTEYSLNQLLLAPCSLSLVEVIEKALIPLEIARSLLNWLFASDARQSSFVNSGLLIKHWSPCFRNERTSIRTDEFVYRF